MRVSIIYNQGGKEQNPEYSEYIGCMVDGIG